MGERGPLLRRVTGGKVLSDTFAGAEGRYCRMPSKILLCRGYRLASVVPRPVGTLQGSSTGTVQLRTWQCYCHVECQTAGLRTTHQAH